MYFISFIILYSRCLKDPEKTCSIVTVAMNIIRLSEKCLSFYEEIIMFFVLYYFVELRTIHFVMSR